MPFVLLETMVLINRIQESNVKVMGRVSYGQFNVNMDFQTVSCSKSRLICGLVSQPVCQPVNQRLPGSAYSS